MRGYSTMSDKERNSILQQHSAFYNGYAIGNIPSGPQPLLQDEGPTDSQGITVNNRGEVSTYKNHLVNESVVSEQDKGRLAGDSKEEKPMKDDELSTELPPRNDDFEKPEPLDLGKDDVKEYAADDMDVSDVEGAYDFESGGPEQFDDEDSVDFNIEDIMNMIQDVKADFGDDEYDSQIDSYTEKEDGKEMYPDEIPAYQFDSEGSMNVDLYEKEDLGGDGEVIEIQTCNECGSEMKEGECTECGSSMYEDVDEDLRESFISQKNEIKEMFNKFNKFN
jgi:hypothetical protein